MINFHPDNSGEMKPRITVIGIGGAGGNAVNNMIQSQLEGVDFIVANTDAQALTQSRADRRIQLGQAVTQGLGAGARPDIGHAAAEESLDEILNELQGSNMVFITAGMGGGTGTGAAPVIAKAARESGILTLGVVTKPFHFEGRHRMRLAEQGLEELSRHVDTLIIIPNQNLFRVASERTTFADAFKMADDVLYAGVRGVTDLMVMPGLVNLDFADIRTMMSEMGKAMMGTGEAEGEKRALDAAEAAINNPLLEDISMKGARGVLVNVTGGRDITLFEVDEAINRIRDEVDPEANIIFGATFDDKMDGKMRVSVVATGIDAVEAEGQQPGLISLSERIAASQPAQPASPAQPAAQQPMFRPAPAAEAPAFAPRQPQQHQQPAAGHAQPQQPPLTAQRRPQPMAQGQQPVQGSLRIGTPEPRLQTSVAYERKEPEIEPGLPESHLDEESPRRTVGFLSRLASHARAAAHAQEPAQPAPERPRETPAPQQSAHPAGIRPTRISPADRLPSSRDAEEDMIDIPAFLRRQAN